MVDHGVLAQLFESLRALADTALAREGFEPHARQFVRTADLRYYGQAYEVRVDLPDGPVTPESTAAAAEAFHDAHDRLYGYHFRGDPRQEVEWVNVRVTGVGPITKPTPSLAHSGVGAQAAQRDTREVFFDDWVLAAVYDRDRLGAGDVVVGPAIVEEFGSTVPVHPGFTATVDRFGNVLLAREAR